MSDTNAKPALIIPALGGLYSALRPFAWMSIRVVTGLFMVPHGAQKLFGGIEGTAAFFAKIGIEPATFFAYLVGSTEFFGGILIALGLLTRPAAAGAAILMLVAAIHVHLPNGFFVNQGGLEYALMWAVLAVAVLIQGGGAYSLDRRIGREF